MRAALATICAMLGVLGSACAGGSPTSVHDLRTELPGTWAEVFDPAPPGISRQFALAVQDSTVSGTGTYTGEAIEGGTIAVTGFIAGSTVHLDLAFTPQSGGTAAMYHFNGQLSGPNTLSGAWWSTSDPVMATFTRASQ